MTEFVVYDVFTDHAFGGNQLAIIPDATTLPEDQLQKIAREFNFSETVFLYPPQDAANTACVRIFTPTTEVPFAGHPTIGTIIALTDTGHGPAMTLELGIGPLACQVDDGVASFVTTAPLERLAKPSPDLVARALGLTPDDLDQSAHAPVQASLGLPFVIVALRDRDALRRCQPVTDAIREGAQLHPAGLDFALFAYCRDGDTIDARMFAPLDNIPEDPATGSASATLAALLTEIAQTPLALTIRQGEDMGRPSTIFAKTTLPGPVSVTISGNAVKTMEGRLVI
ncbi:PhzF family phenazine biosynthesis protein [Yoonia sp. 208BN28-4]|uniref:PhzF family phenazine biosynthesis protein n=1 Tax=Yoonia sp. 208BN28-4 TaxID=3126505 RepID=UPI0030AD5A57